MEKTDTYRYTANECDKPDCYMLFQGYEYITKLWYNQLSEDAMQAIKSKMESRILLEEKN